VRLAQLDGSLYGDVDNATNGAANLSVPVATNTQYYLFIQHPAAAAGAHDFYFVEHFGGTFSANPLETSEVANDLAATAEPLLQQDNGDGTFSYFVEGDLPTLSDVDHFSMFVPPGTTTVQAFCSAQREGSGLRSFTFGLLDGSGTPIA